MDSITGCTKLCDKPFFDVYVHNENDKIVFCYRTGLTVYEEVFDSGKLISGGMNGAGYPQNVLDSFPIRVSQGAIKPSYVFEFEAQGVSAQTRLEYIDFEKNTCIRENGTEYIHAVLTLKSKSAPVRVKVHTELDGTPVLVRYLEIINDSDNPVNISNITPLCGCLEELEGWDEYSKTKDINKIYSLGYMDFASWGCEGLFRWHDVKAGGNSVFGRYEADRFRHPCFMLRNNLTGSIVNAQLAHSGGYEFMFDLSNDIPQCSFTGGAVETARMNFAVKIKSPNPQYVLSGAQSLKTPEVHFEKTFGSLDDSVNYMHEHMRKSVFVLPKPHGITGLLASGMGAERVMDMDAVKHFVDTAAEVGAEAFILDAGWYCPPHKQGEWHIRTGNWWFDSELYPNGGEEVIDYVHGKGLMFGLWFDPERMGSSSEIAAMHPEWLGKYYSCDNVGTVIDMTIPEAAEWVESELCRMFETYKIDLFRLDYNIGAAEIFVRSNDGEGEYCNTLAYYEAVNGMYERLRKRFPDMFFENCAGGGGRTDIGIVRNFTHTWVSDWQVAPRSFAITNGMTMALPPEYVDRLVSGMFCHTRASLDFQIRQTLFGKPTTNSYNPVYSSANPAQLAFVKHSYDIYKNFIRPYAADGKIYHHTPEIYGLRPIGTGIIERASSDRTRSAIGVFRLADSADEKDVVVYPRGIDIDGKYRVSFDNAVISGKNCGSTLVEGFKLVNDGIRVRLEDSLTSELILLEKAE